MIIFPPIIMVQWKMGLSNIRFLSFRMIFRFHDYGRKGKVRQSHAKRFETFAVNIVTALCMDGQKESEANMKGWIDRFFKFNKRDHNFHVLNKL